MICILSKPSYDTTILGGLSVASSKEHLGILITC